MNSYHSWLIRPHIACKTFGTDFERSKDCATSCLVLAFMLRVIKLLVRNQSACSWILPFVLWPITKKSHTFRCSSLFFFPTPVRRLCWTISRRNHPFCVAEDKFCSGEHVDKSGSLRTLLSLSFKTCNSSRKLVQNSHHSDQFEWITQLCWNEFLYCLHFSGILECGNFFISISKFPTAVVSHEV